MTAAITIRPANAEDALSIARIHVETWRSSYAGILPDDYLTRLSVSDSAVQWARSVGRDGAADGTLAAVAEGDVVGFISYGPQRGRWDFAGEIYALYVGLDWQNQGIGRRLVAAAFAGLVNAGPKSAIVWVLSRNPSRFFYGAVGGQLIGHRTERFAGTELEETAYGWRDLAAWLANTAPS